MSFKNGNTALHEASWNGYSKCVELLVNAKCNANLHNRVSLVKKYTKAHINLCP